MKQQIEQPPKIQVALMISPDYDCTSCYIAPCKEISTAHHSLIFESIKKLRSDLNNLDKGYEFKLIVRNIDTIV